MEALESGFSGRWAAKLEFLPSLNPSPLSQHFSDQNPPNFIIYSSKSSDIAIPSILTQIPKDPPIPPSPYRVYCLHSSFFIHPTFAVNILIIPSSDFQTVQQTKPVSPTSAFPYEPKPNLTRSAPATLATSYTYSSILVFTSVRRHLEPAFPALP